MKRLILKSLLATTLTLALSCSVAYASAGPSVNNCATLGTIEVECFICHYQLSLGKTAVSSKYNPVNDTCTRNGEILEACAGLRPGFTKRTVSAKWQYTVGGEKVTGAVNPCP